MKANAIKTLGAFAVVLLLVSGTLFAQQQGPGRTPEAVADPYVGMTAPADVVIPTNPTIGVLVEDAGLLYGIYKKIPARIKTNEQMPPAGPEAGPVSAPSYWTTNISYYTDPNGTEFSVKYVTEGGKWDFYPAAPADPNDPAQRDAYGAAIEKWHAEYDQQ